MLAGIDAHAEALGLSRVEYIRRRLAQDARTARVPVSRDDLQRFGVAMAGLADDELRERVAELESEGKLAAVYLANTERQTVFLVVNADTVEEATSTVATLPMAAWWDLDVFPLNAPAPLGDVAAALNNGRHDDPSV